MIDRDGYYLTAFTASATDYELIQRIAKGDEAALAELYDRYCRLVMGVALAIGGDRATAEEVTLDIFLRVWQHAAAYDPALSRVPTWLSRLARNRAIDRLRREAARPAGHSITFDDAVLNSHLPGDMEAAVDLVLERRRVRAAVAALPVDQRQALALAFFQGYTHAEIAAMLEQSLGTVKGRIRGGMTRLRELLNAEELAVRPEKGPLGDGKRV